MKRNRRKVGILLCLALLLGAPLLAKGEIANDTILIGSSAALGGPNAFLGTEFHKGAKLYFEEVNRKGGIYGRIIKSIVLDDGYEPERTILNTKNLINEEKVDYLFGYIGTPTTVSILDMIEKERILLFAAFTGAEQLRKPVKRYMINVRPSYYQETAGLVNHLLNYCGVERIACFYQDDAYGMAGYTGVKLALEKYGLTLCGEGTYERNTVAIVKGLEQIRKSSPDAVIMVGQYTACAAFMEAARITELKNTYFCNISFVGSDKLNAVLGKNAERAICSQVVPDLANEKNPLTKEFLIKYQEKYEQDIPNHVAFEGYISAILFVEGLRRAGEDLTGEGFINAIEKIKDLDIGVGDKITYGKFDHQGLDKVYYSIVKNGKEVALTDWVEQATK
jgi:ABC-type branched-subunit amino acid transport system substrate-binding protein